MSYTTVMAFIGQVAITWTIIVWVERKWGKIGLYFLMTFLGGITIGICIANGY